MSNVFIFRKVIGTSNMTEHHNVAAKLRAMSDKWDEIEAKTGIRPAEAFDYTFGLIDGKSLIFGVLPENLDAVMSKISSLRKEK